MIRPALALPLGVALTACGGSDQAPAPAEAPLTQQGAAQPQDAGNADITELPVADGSLNLVTVKDAGVEVPGEFRTISGTVAMPLGAPQGTTADLTIDLASWDSGLELRDDRVRATFFGVDAHPTATFRLDGIETGGALGVVGDRLEGTARGTLTWRGKELPVEAPVAITRRAEKTVEVMSTSPFTVSISALDMGAPLQALIELCQHQSISDEVRVSIDLLLGEGAAAPADDAPADDAPADDAPTDTEAEGNPTAPRLPGKLEVAPAPKLVPTGTAPTRPKITGPKKQVPLDQSGD